MNDARIWNNIILLDMILVIFFQQGLFDQNSILNVRFNYNLTFPVRSINNVAFIKRRERMLE